MNARQSKSHRLPPTPLALVIVLGVALLAGAFGSPARIAAQAPAAFAIIKDFGDTLYPGSSLSTGGALLFRGAVVADSIAYFQAYTPDTGYEIWRSDGSEAGTFILKDFCPGDGYQFPTPQMVALDATVYFAANDCVSGRELWKSNGTPGGTQLVKDIYPGPNGGEPENLFVADGKLFFTAHDGTLVNIWKSDGTEAGTTSTGIAGTPIFALGNGLFFTANEGGSCKIKRLDTASNAVSDLTPMCPRSIYPSGFGGISIAAGATLAYFTAGDNSTGAEVWRSDGTPAGTFLLKDIRPGAETSRPLNFVVNSLNQLIFSASDGTNGEELWKSDGTIANTSMIKDINAGAASSGPNRITLWGGSIFFTAYDGAQTELWRSNGFGSGTTIVRDLTPSAGVSSSPSFLTPAANVLFFVASDDTHANALFKTDGTANGTVLVKDLNPTGVSSEVYVPVAFGAGIFFLGNNGVNGEEPWFSDGSDAGTRMIKDIVGPENLGSRPRFLTSFNGQTLYFGWNLAGGTSGDSYALYGSDGSAAGTQALKTFSLAPENETDGDQALALFNGALYFAARSSSSDTGDELWRSDGTAAGTALFVDLNPGPNSGSPRWLTPAGQTLFFRSNNTNNGDELWKTNGTLETTALVKDIQAGSNGSFPEFLTPDSAGGVYFAASDGAAGVELWHSDGTATNTRMLLDIKPGSQSSYPENLTLVEQNLFFTAEDAASGRELWVTNGAPEGTKRVRDITAGTASTSFDPDERPFVVFGSRVFFIASSDLFGRELWASDGSENGTAIVKDIYPGVVSSNLQELTVMNGALYFVATGDDGKRTLWRSDGTTTGTGQVRSDADAPVNPESLSVIDGWLYFSAADQSASVGRELWVSDGTADGIRMLQDLNPGPTNSNPRGMVKADNRIYLSAYQPGAGVELWAAQTQRSMYVPLVQR
jgi:ELWxxDGT repeat protein